jgi:hypothetical protein
MDECSFLPPAKFVSAYEDEIKQRTTWYYCPQALSEYKVPFLDIAHRLGVLGLMAPPEDLDGGYVENLFSGAQPSTVGFTGQAAFRHYLHALKGQTLEADQTSFDTALDSHGLWRTRRDCCSACAGQMSVDSIETFYRS